MLSRFVRVQFRLSFRFVGCFCTTMLVSFGVALAQSRIDTHIAKRSTDSLQAAYINLSADNVRERLEILNALAEAYQYTSTDSSLRYALEAKVLAEKLQDSRAKAWALYYAGYAYYNQGKYDITLETLLAALPLFEAAQDKQGIGHTLNDLGNIYKRQGQYEKALDYYRAAMNNFNAVGDKRGIVLELCNIGATYRLSGNGEEALRYSHQGFMLSDSIDYNYGRTFASANIGMLYLHQKNYILAEQYCEKALQIALREDNEKYISQMYYTLGTIAAYQKNFVKALDFAEKGKRIAQDRKFAERIKESYKAFVEIYTLKGDYVEALRYQKEFSALHDSIFSAEVRGNIADLQTKVATEKKDKEIALLLKDQEIAALQRNSLVIGFVLVVLLLVLAFSRYLIKRNAARELALLNHSLASSNGQLGKANAQLGEANAEISRQLEIQAEQAREIEIANTALQELNLRLEHQNNDLVALNMEKNEFLGIAAHDLKNPINGIRGLAEILINFGKEIPDEEKLKILHSIIGSSERMFELIKNLLDINTIEQGGLKLTLVAFDVTPLLIIATDSYNTRAAEKNITVEFSNPGAMMIYADEQATAQVLDNIISNAVKYSPHGKQVFIRASRFPPKKMNVSIENAHTLEEKLDALQHQDRVRIEIQDQGPGLSKQDMNKLFGKFARLSAQPTGGEHSTGLGLSIVKRMVEAMNGKVWCESEEGKGATFIVELPAA